MSTVRSIAQYYHQQTKYDPETLGAQSRGLDWSAQPSPYKDYPIGSTLDLKPHLQLHLEEPESRRPGERSTPPKNRERQPFDRDRAKLITPSFLSRLSRLLYLGYGLTQKVMTPQGPFYLRSAPSAGGLYPAELYVISAGLPELPAGLYNYQARSHALLKFWDADLWPSLTAACLWHPSLESTKLALVMTGVFQRSAWRYQARAYRRICLDSGHLLGNLELAGSLTDLRPHLIGGFVDEAVNQLLYLDESQEGAIAVLPLADLLTIEQNLPRMRTALPSPLPLPSSLPSSLPSDEAKGAATTGGGAGGVTGGVTGGMTSDAASELEIPEDELLQRLHQASQITAELGETLTWRPLPKPKPGSGEALISPTCFESPLNPGAKSGSQSGNQAGGSQPGDNPLGGNLDSCLPPVPSNPAAKPQDAIEPPADKYNFPFCSRSPLVTEAIDWGGSLEAIDGSLDGLERTLVQRRSTRGYSGAPLTLADLKAILDFTYHPEHYRLQGLDEAPDYFALDLIETFIAVSGVDGLDEGCYYYAPKAQELRQIRFKNFRDELHYLCLGQELGRDAAAVVFHTADLAQSVAVWGDRAYRYLHLDAGHLGQRLNLAAIGLNLGVSGIGGFFDDQVNEILGIPEAEAVLYVTTLGQP